MFETIVALATPPLKSALAVIRLSGDDCFDVVSKCFTHDLREINKRTLLVGSIINNGEKIDDVVAAIYKGPKSFTGEDSVEIICHGSMLIANQIIEVLLQNGARLATNGEFSSRAFLHQKVDLVQAESINDVINATTKEAKQLSLLSLSGEVSKLITPIKTKLADIISLIEVNIDFPEYEDIEIANKELIVESVNKINEQIDKLIKDGEKAKIIKDGIKVAIVGKPNVGKSSLLNALTGEEKAIVTDIAGTTRDIVEGEINLKGVVLHLLDTAGIREASDKVESIGVERAKKTISEAELVIVVLDASHELEQEDKEILDYTKDSNRIIVYNKSDKAVINLDNNLSISALNNNIEPLVNEIYRVVGLDEQSFKQPALNNTRQIGLLKHAKEALLRAKEDATNNMTVDLISVSLMEAYQSILEILGETNQVDLSKEIFSRFCVGK
ncbi:MAG: tRNA uridine-5-carboxymethylaminomethyl(34) synthesis GTPase MnmE [Bacilli bacterium]|nr:tRNA uridine-5-carboxymethylaminomethyl(34) synthesis GTPase MnmE [Bacilli bacterium]